MEQLPAGYGIMADDILAGVYGAAVVYIAQILCTA
jgi:phosphatidylglycerophosphatase A